MVPVTEWSVLHRVFSKHISSVDKYPSKMGISMASIRKFLYLQSSDFSSKGLRPFPLCSVYFYFWISLSYVKNAWNCTDKGIEMNVIKALSELLVNWFTCSSCGVNWNSNWPHCPLLVIQGGVISGEPVHLCTIVVDDCRVITRNSGLDS